MTTTPALTGMHVVLLACQSRNDQSPPKKTNNKKSVKNNQNHPGWETYIERGAVKVRPKKSLGEMLFGGQLSLEDTNTPESKAKGVRNSRKK